MDSLPGIIKKFGCGWCSYKTDSKAHLMRHSKSMHKNVEMKIVLNPTYIPPSKQPKDLKRKHQCEMCSYQTDCKSHLRRHQGSVHCKDKLYECPTCKIEFARSEQAKIHHMAYHPEKHFDIRNMHKPASNAKQLKLSVNDKMEKIKTLFDEVEHFTDNLHQLLRVNNAFVCLKCNYSCRDMWHLKRHVLDVHSTLKDFNCKVCHYATSRAHRLYCHMLKHGELFCHLCEFSTVNPEIYKLHSQTCTAAQKSLNCSICSVDFEQMGVYRDHISSHH
ncbi:hypothetical protein HELRODRAFT_76025, partial [Helobdella robusta]|uniref:C2H2-type domain-containing protein n=1 Tax=Helobdella robusta TaxID=6412 RepID=T1G2E2_HELRO